MSDDPTDTDSIDFADVMKQLASEAGAPKSDTGSNKAPAQSITVKFDKHDLLLSFGEMVRPLAIDLDLIKRAGSDNNLLLVAVGKSLNAQRNVTQSLETIAAQMQRLGSVESANQKLFDAMHAELKGYKDNFLFDALQKPMIKELVTIFDDFSAVFAQSNERLTAVREASAGVNAAELAFLERLVGNMENQLHHLLEVFLRMDVAIARTPPNTPLDKRTHRIVGFKPAASVAEDNLVARSARPGFFWRERTVRPEDVIVLRWTPPGGSPREAPRPHTVPIDISGIASFTSLSSAPPARNRLPKALAPDFCIHP